jgi:nucleoside-diphosphate-sugar epimerase
VILFTGFPGFIGERLLPRLLQAFPSSPFACLVQEKFLLKARGDLEVLEEKNPDAKGRVSLLTGDITRPGLGLGEPLPDFTAAFHLAAVYDLAVSRELGERVNVLGTRNLIEVLRRSPSFSRLHYVSTAYVSGTFVGVFRETDLEKGQSFKNHYEATKHEAEVAVVHSGIPATVYRPGIVVGDSRTGETGKFDGPYFALRAMERIPSPGLFMRVGSGRRTINLVPVDFVIDAMAALAPLEGSLGKTYHLVDPNPPSVLEVEKHFAGALGKRFLYVPVPPSLAKAVFRSTLVSGFFGMPSQAVDYFDHPCSYDASQAQQDLGPLGVRCPPFGQYVGRLVEFYRAHRDSVRREAMV